MPRGGEQESPALHLSLAASFEEPDLKHTAKDGYARQLIDPDNASSLDFFKEEKCLHTDEKAGVVIAKVSSQGQSSVALYCKYPLKLITELSEDDSPSSEGLAYYQELSSLNKSTLDPLLLAMPDVKSSAIRALENAGEEVARYELPSGKKVTLSTVTDNKEIRSLLKPFEPGFFSGKSNPFVLDGPIMDARERLKKGEEFIFACLVPVGEGVAELETRELIVEAKDESTSADNNLQITEDLDIRAYPFIDDEERTYVSKDWEEDLRLESEIADCAALLRRDKSELAIVIGESSESSHGIEALYHTSAIAADTTRVIVAGESHASKEFTSGRGIAAFWTPRYGRKNLTQAILERRPSLAVRRAMVGLALPIPFGLVAELE